MLWSLKASLQGEQHSIFYMLNVEDRITYKK
jgi:hypothetical protein